MRFTFIILLFFGFTGSAIAQAPLQMVYFEDFAPFSWQVKGQMKGIYIDILDEILHGEMGLKVTHRGFPWKRAQIMVQMNKADGFVTVHTAQRKTYTIAGREPVHRFDISLFTHKDSKVLSKLKQVKNLTDLDSFHTVNYLGNGWAKENLSHMAVDWVPTLEEALTLLARNRYDLFVGTPETVLYYLQRLGRQDQVIEIPIIMDSISIQLCIGQDSPFINILPEFDKKMKRLRDSGKLTDIYTKYR